MKIKVATTVSMTECPVCILEFYRVDRSEHVCAYHQACVVTICKVCGRTAFSDVPGACPDHVVRYFAIKQYLAQADW